MIRIVIDSSSDYEIQEIREKNLTFIPIHVTMNDKNYRDSIDLKKNEFFEMLVSSNDFPKTAQPSPQEFLTIFEDAKEKGDSVICILLSSGLSGTCQSAALAKSMVEYDDIYIVDSLTATYCIKILVEHALLLREKGLPASEIATKLDSLKSRIRLFAVLDTLEYLSKGGRIPRSVAAIGDMARLKPVITLTQEGQVGVLGKCIGKNKAASYVMKCLSDYTVDTDFPFYTIYSYGTNNCEFFEQRLTQENYSITKRLQIGATIGAHIGPEAYGIVFVSK